MSIKFLPAILGPEMAAPILRAPGIFWFFLLENAHAHKIPPLGGGGCWHFLDGGGWKCQFYFCGRGDFSDKVFPPSQNLQLTEIIGGASFLRFDPTFYALSSVALL